MFIPINNLSLSPLFSDGMVLQRETTVSIWGKAKPNQNITIVTTWGNEASSTSDLNGNWILNLNTKNAGGPYSITIFSFY